MKKQVTQNGRFVWNYFEYILFLTMPENKMEMVSFYKTMEVDMDNAIVVKVTTISRERKQVSSCKCTICLRIGMIKNRRQLSTRDH